MDPLEYRLRFLKDQRARDVLAKAAETFGWDKFEKKAGRGRGIAFAEYKNYAGFCAVAMEVEVNRRNGTGPCRQGCHGCRQRARGQS